MDDFKQAQMSHVGPAGMRCTCCNNLHHKTRKKLNRLARAKIKHLDRQEKPG